MRRDHEDMEAASIGRHRRRGPTWKAPLALALYAGALFVAWTLVSDAGTVGTEETPAAPAEAEGPAGTELTLTNHATRAARSIVTIGETAGFVAWTANGLSLVLTVRPTGGWQTDEDRRVTVTVGGSKHDGKLVRSDPRTGLGLVRVQGQLARPLWQSRAPAAVRKGDRLAIAGSGQATLFAVTEARHRAIWGADAGTAPGRPVLNEAGRVVGITTGGRVVPIDRACGSIRRC
ncbi:MAG: S1C family serine protease [Actinomycetota bacterium]|nr:S1C family serine protease [Actinomycetota bacterium]